MIDVERFKDGTGNNGPEQSPQGVTTGGLSPDTLAVITALDNNTSSQAATSTAALLLNRLQSENAKLRQPRYLRALGISVFSTLVGASVMYMLMNDDACTCTGFDTTTETETSFEVVEPTTADEQRVPLPIPAVTAPPIDSSSALAGGGVEIVGVQPNEPLDPSGVAFAKNEVSPGSFIDEENVRFEWLRRTASPDGKTYAIQLQQVSPVGGYEPNESLREKIRTGVYTENELVNFLVSNRVIPSYVDDIAILLVGAGDEPETIAYIGEVIDE